MAGSGINENQSQTYCLPQQSRPMCVLFVFLQKCSLCLSPSIFHFAGLLSVDYFKMPQGTDALSIHIQVKNTRR